MIRSRISYLFILLPIGICNLFFGGYIFLLVLLLMLSFPLFSFLAMRIQISSIKLAFLYQNHQFMIRSGNFKLFPLINLQIPIILENSFTGEKQKHNYWLFSGSKEKIILEDDHTAIGNYILRIEGYEGYDMLGLFKKRFSCQQQQTFMIKPDLLPTNLIVQIENAGEKENGWINSNHSGYMEDKHEVREYIPGDKLNRIHHKLSYKLSKTMVREFVSVEKEEIDVFVDLSGTIEECIYAFSYFKDLALFFLKQEQSIRCFWQSQMEMPSFEITQEEDIARCIEEMLMNPKPQEFYLPHIDGIAWVVNGEGVTSLKGGNVYETAK